MKYTMAGAFHPEIHWDDFLSEEGPSATICLEGETDRPPIPPGKDYVAVLADDGWYNVTTKKMDRVTTATILAAINGVFVERIEIEEMGVMSVCVH